MSAHDLLQRPQLLAAAAADRHVQGETVAILREGERGLLHRRTEALERDQRAQDALGAQELVNLHQRRPRLRQRHAAVVLHESAAAERYVPIGNRVLGEEKLVDLPPLDRKSTRLNSSHLVISYAV